MKKMQLIIPSYNTLFNNDNDNKTILNIEQLE